MGMWMRIEMRIGIEIGMIMMGMKIRMGIGVIRMGKIARIRMSVRIGIRMN